MAIEEGTKKRKQQEEMHQNAMQDQKKRHEREMQAHAQNERPCIVHMCIPHRALCSL